MASVLGKASRNMSLVQVQKARPRRGENPVTIRALYLVFIGLNATSNNLPKYP